MALEASIKSRDLITNLDNIVNSLPNHLVASQQLNDDTDKTQKDIVQSNKQCKRNILK